MVFILDYDREKICEVIQRRITACTTFFLGQELKRLKLPLCS